MSHAPRTSVLLLLIAMLLGAAHGARCEPLFTLSEDGRTFLYRARPGDRPGVVAEMFGVSQHDVPAFLTANGISDPTRVGAGFVYRVPNAAVLGLNQRVAALEADTARLQRDLTQAQAQTHQLSQEADDAKSRAAVADAHAARADRLAWWWPIGQFIIVFLALACAGVAALAVAAVRRQRQAERFARTLADELESKRKGGLLERQDSARRVLELEARIRSLETQLGPRVLLGRG